MARAADYDIISVPKKSLRIGGDIDEDFAIGMVNPNVGARSMLLSWSTPLGRMISSFD